jgi:hypothetical protein
MRKHSAPLAPALRFLTRIRPTVAPPLAFQLQLSNYEVTLGLPSDSHQSRPKEEVALRGKATSTPKTNKNTKHKIISTN